MRSNAQWADFLCRARNRLILLGSFFDYSDSGDRRAEGAGGEGWIPSDFIIRHSGAIAFAPFCSSTFCDWRGGRG